MHLVDPEDHMKISTVLTVVASLAITALLIAAEPPKTETTPSGMKITRVAPGEGAKAGDTVSVLYTGKLENGTEFDSSAKHGGDPIEFQLGKSMVIKGWDEGVTGMQVGEKRTLVIPPSLGYGEQGAGGVIPPNATLTFDVELVALRRPAPAPAAPGAAGAPAPADAPKQ
jgi:FKBP-type peptidyl-prolyl cis-trans isomerase